MDYLVSLVHKKKNKRRKTGKHNNQSKRSQHKKKRMTMKAGKITRKMNCSPAVKGKTALENTCFTVSALNTIKDEYNKDHPGNKITTTDPATVWQELNQRLTKCSTEDCWLESIDNKSLRAKIDNYIFAPDAPKEWSKNPNEWLSNYDIKGVLEQYKQTYSDFDYIEPAPIDFDKVIDGGCVVEKLCKFDLAKYKKAGKTKIGMVFNLDKHDEPGSHWVSLYVDLVDGLVFYFDSTGAEIPQEIRVLKDRIIEQGKKNGLEIKYYDSKNNEHQKSNTECGMYSLYFIITMITGDDGEKKVGLKDRLDLFMKKKINDGFVEKYRKIYFN